MTGRKFHKRDGVDRYGARDTRRGGGNGAFYWAIFLLLLIGFTFFCWFGSFYVFGHPEKPFNYALLSKLKKIEPPKRFQLTAAPRGKFLKVDEIYEKYANLTPALLAKENEKLIRNYLRNYHQPPEPVPYLVGTFTIEDSFELTPEDFFPSGVVVLARSNENPNVLLEHVFPAEPKMVPNVHRALLTGVEWSFRRAYDLSPIIHVEKLPDGRLKITAVPIAFGDYTSTITPGTFTLSPSKELNVAAGLPVLNRTRVREAEEKYAAYRRRAGLAETSGSPPPAAPELIRVQPAEAVDGSQPAPPPPPEKEEPVVAEAAPSPSDATLAAEATPTPQIPDIVRRAEPVNPEMAREVEIPAPLAEVSPSPTPAPSPSPSPTPGVELKPFLAASPTPTPTPVAQVTNANSRSWPTYRAGQMPRGRLLNMPDMPQLANRGLGGERIYLQGNFVVTASGSNRAVLRAQNAVSGPLAVLGKTGTTRVIVEFPEGQTPPSEGSQFSRDARRPFLITDIRRTEDGQVNVYAREITTP